MFTGIIEKIGVVRQIEAERGGGPGEERSRIGIQTGYRDLEPGESVAVNGVCLTVASRFGEDGAAFFVSGETLARSNLSRLSAGARVNLERALETRAGPGSRLSGHFVQGHVDGTATLTSVREQGGSHLLEVELPAALSRYCVEKGSIALDGVSLTINRITQRAGSGPALLELCLIPHTWEHTSFSERLAGDPLNVEVDVLAKYMEKLCQPYLKP